MPESLAFIDRVVRALETELSAATAALVASLGSSAAGRAPSELWDREWLCCRKRCGTDVRLLAGSPSLEAVAEVVSLTAEAIAAAGAFASAFRAVVGVSAAGVSAPCGALGSAARFGALGSRASRERAGGRSAGGLVASVIGGPAWRRVGGSH